MISRLVLVVGVLLVGTAHAGVFNVPKFVEKSRFALGLEPEVILTSGAGLGMNARFVYGLSDLTNVTAILGTGAGPHRFRAGGNLILDVFPDVGKQPGMGMAFQGLFMQLEDHSNRFQTLAIPYIHKAFQVGDGDEVNPFLTIPFGINFDENQRYQVHSQFAIGAMFSGPEKLQYVLELGVAINHAESYVSGGVIYFH